MMSRIAVLEVESPAGETGGAERLTAGIRENFRVAGIDAERIVVRVNERTFAGIREAYLHCYDLDLSRFDGVVSMKAPTYVVRHPNHVCYLMHTMRVFYDMFGTAFPRRSTRCFEKRRFIHALDTAALMRTRGLYAIGHEVARRLHRYNGLVAQVVRPPSSLQGLHGGGFRYMFLPGRLHPWKRVDLAINAMKFVTAPIDLVISGTGSDEVRLRRRAAGDRRIRFVGHVSDKELTELYADALGVVFVPRGEDLGFVTLEAFRAGKPVITCTDSGEPAQMVCDGRSGFICSPDPHQIAGCIEKLVHDPVRAATMGQLGRASIACITWDHVVGALSSGMGIEAFEGSQEHVA